MEQSESSTRELTLEEAVSVAILLQKIEQLDQAQELYRRVLETAPDHPRALHYAGVLAHQQGRNGEALALIERSVALVPDQADWFSNLGIVLQSDDRLPLAIDAYRRAIAIDPSHANAHNNLGVLLRAMLALAQDKNVYHALMKAELTDYLRDNREAFDLVVSADALVYFGGLEGVIAAVAGALRPDGLFVFTLEHAVGDRSVDYRLELHGRYCHARAYVEQVLRSAGLQPTIMQADLRMEAGAPVPGLVIRAAKPG